MKLSWTQMLSNRISAWRFWKYPVPEPLPPKPWHADGDEALTAEPTKLHPKSADFIKYLSLNARFFIGTGSTVPNLDGKVEGYPLNRAHLSDRLYEISEEPGPGKLWVHTGYKATYGAYVRYRPSMFVQGNPMQMYSDHKLHVYDEHGEVDTITEVQGFIDDGNGHLRCDGATQYPVSVPSWDVTGRSAARRPLAEHTLRYDDVVARGWVQRASMGIVGGSTQFVYPATGSDGPSLSASAPPFGVILKLTEAACERLTKAGYGRGTNPQAHAVMDCYRAKGIIIVDSGGNHATNLEPDPRWDQKDLAALKMLSLSDFECWTL